MSTGNYAEYAWSHANIPAELASIQPLGDCVLVKVIPEPETAALIVIPTGARERGYQPPRVGEVIAVGPGDKALIWECDSCKQQLTTTSKVPTCPHCHHRKYSMQLVCIDERHEMHVKPGDRILYWRCQANEVVINDETYQFLHEEQHILGVIED